MKHLVTGLERETLFLWHPDNPTSLPVHLPHVIPSKPLPYERNGLGKTVDEVLAELASRKIVANTFRLSSKKAIVQVTGPPSIKEQLRDLSAYFCIGTKERPDSRNNVSRMRRIQVGWPFGYVELNGDAPIFELKAPTIDELCSLPSDAFDSEFEGWEPVLKFDDLDVDEETLRNFLRSVNLPADGDKKALVRAVADYKLANDKYEPFAICYVTSTGFPNFYFTKYPLPEQRTKVSTEFGEYTFENIVVKDIKDMDSAFERIVSACGEKFAPKLREYYEQKKKKVKSLADAITFLFAIAKRAYNAVLTGGHNIGSYDYPKIRSERKNSLFVSGIDGAVPRIDADLGFFRRSVEPGRHNIDTCLLSQKFMAGTIDNKLVTYIRHLFGLTNIKDLTYDDTTKNRVESFFGNLESALENAVYCMKDTIYHFQGMEAVKRSILLLSLLLKQSPEVACSTSFRRLSENLLQLASLKKSKCYTPVRFGDFLYAPEVKSKVKVTNPSTGRPVSLSRAKYDKFDLEAEKNKLLLSLSPGQQQTLFGVEEAPPNPFLRKALRTKVAHCQADIFYLTPFIAAFSYFVDKNPAAVAVVGEISKLSLEDRVARQNRLILAQGLQRDFLGVLVHTALNYSPSRGHSVIDEQSYSDEAHIFSNLFGISLQELNAHIYSAKQKFQDAVLRFGAEVINSDTLTAVSVPENRRKEFAEFLERERLGYYYGRAEVISTARSGSFLLRIDDEFMAQGIDAKFTRGLKNEYENHFMHEFLRLIFEEGHSSAVDLLAKTVEDLRSGSVDANRLLYVTRENRRNPEEFSLRALFNRNVLQKILNKVKKGETFAWGYSSNGALPAPEIFSAGCDPAMYLKVMFGEEKKKWTFRSYTYEKDGKDSIAITSCGSLVESVLVYNTDDKQLQKQKHEALTRIVKGETIGDEAEILCKT
ncbi:MAG TPA: hypothetical protein VI612_05415 [Candidatus Nanoarchaeia archaeon]|nr:hypothetical protein [Candidatus Nanoarchaeia archaeon]